MSKMSIPLTAPVANPASGQCDGMLAIFTASRCPRLVSGCLSALHGKTGSSLSMTRIDARIVVT
jgi:hypothetical protein